MAHMVSADRTTLVLFLMLLVVAAGISAQTHLGSVSIDGVTNQLTSTRLSAGSTHVASIRYNFTPLSAGWWNGANAFELYSPDGADWVDLAYTLGPVVTGLGPSVVKFRKYYTSADNGVTYTQTAMFGSTQPGGSSGADSRVAYSLAIADASGLGGYAGGSGGTNGIALTLQFQSLIADEGKTICVDTVNGAGTVAWQWTSASLSDYPAWDNGLGVNGPRCWAIGACPNMPPQWCNGTIGNVSFAYCRTGSYNLCAIPSCDGPLEYSLVPPYNDGNYGTIDAQTGLWTWSGPTVPPGGAVEIPFQVSEQGSSPFEPFTLRVVTTTASCDCCIGRVGDANNSGEDEPTIGDVSAIIDYLFISNAPLTCIEEADINQSGGATPYASDITIGDVSALIDYLFITGPDTGTLPACL